jgi:hypothetical protein
MNLAIRLICGVSLALIAAPSFAEICYFNSSSAPNASSVFACPQAGNKTIAQLAMANFRVRQMSPTVGAGGATVWQLILQRSDRVFVSGFEN